MHQGDPPPEQQSAGPTRLTRQTNSLLHHTHGLNSAGLSACPPGLGGAVALSKAIGFQTTFDDSDVPWQEISAWREGGYCESRTRLRDGPSERVMSVVWCRDVGAALAPWTNTSHPQCIDDGAADASWKHVDLRDLHPMPDAGWPLTDEVAGGGVPACETT